MASSNSFRNGEGFYGQTELHSTSYGSDKYMERNKWKGPEIESQWKEAIGVLKDVASIGFAKLNRPMDFLDTAVIKATRHSDSPPKEKHVLSALQAARESSRSRPRLKRLVEERLRRTKNWKVAVKTLALIHRLMRDADPCIFIEEEEQQMQISSRATVLTMTSLQFDDRSSPVALNFSLWVRKYSSYLDQRLRCNRIFRCDILSERHNQRAKDLEIEYIFMGLSSLQLLLGNLLNCAPQAMNFLIQHALDLLLEDGRNIYVRIKYFIHRLIDSFVAGMPKYKVAKLISIYKKFSQLCDGLSEFYSTYRILLSRDNIDLPRVEKPSESFLAEMEKYVMKSENHTSTKELTAMGEESPHTGGEEATQVVVQAVSTGEETEERLLITWWDAHDDVPPMDITNSSTLIGLGSASTFGSSKDTVEEANTWEIALDSSLISPSERYQLEGALDRLSPAVSFDNVLLAQKWGDGTNGDTNMSGYGIHPTVTDDMPSILQLPITEMASNSQQQVLRVAMDNQLQQMENGQSYLPTTNFEDVGELPQCGRHYYSKNPFEDSEG